MTRFRQNSMAFGGDGRMGTNTCTSNPVRPLSAAKAGLSHKLEMVACAAGGGLVGRLKNERQHHTRADSSRIGGGWRKNAAPGEVQQHVVPDALADNGSEPAIALLEELFLGPQPDDQKRVWIQDAVIRHRFELPMIRAAERLVQKFPTGLAVSLVEIYFVYRPDKWYLELTPPKAQPYEQADKRSKQHLLNLATFALDKLPLAGDPELKAKVEATKERLEKE